MTIVDTRGNKIPMFGFDPGSDDHSVTFTKDGAIIADVIGGKIYKTKRSNGDVIEVDSNIDISEEIVGFTVSMYNKSISVKGLTKGSEIK